MALKRRTNPLLAGTNQPGFDIRQLRASTELRDCWIKQAGGSSTGNAKQYRRRFMRIEAAEDAVGKIRRGMADLIVSTGQFSLTECMIVALEQIGPSRMTASTWTIGAQDIETVKTMMDVGALIEPRFVLDHTFSRRQPKYAHMLRSKFGGASLRITNNHAKWLTLRSVEEDWRLAFTTTMNLNQNPRLEILWIHEGKEIVAFLESIVDEIFRRSGEGIDSGTYEEQSSGFSRTMQSVEETWLEGEEDLK